MNSFECILIEYLQRTQGQETVKTLQQKASWSRVGLGLKVASAKHFHII